MLRFIKMSFINLRTKGLNLSAIMAKFRAVGVFFDRLDAAMGGVIGLGDYERYLEHFRRTHPDGKPLSKAQFFRSRQDDKSKNVKC